MADKLLYILAGYDDKTSARLKGIQNKLYECGFSGTYTKNIPLHITPGSFPTCKEKRLSLFNHDVMTPPTKAAADDGIFLEYTPIERDSHRPMNDPSCAENASEGHALKEQIEFFGRKNSQVLEYWMDNSRFSNWKKPPRSMPPDEAVMREDVKFYRDLGFESITSFGCFLGQDYRELHGQPPVKHYGDILKSVQ